MRTEVVDYLVIGSGVAGLRAAIELAPHGRVLVVTKDKPTEGSTEYAQGGVAVALSDEDEVHIHLSDTIKAGDGLCKREAVKVLVEEGPARIVELISWGAEFDREGMRLAFTLEAAHSRKRILHAHGDATGREIERVLLKKVRSINTISRYPFAFTLDLIVEDGRCCGAFLLREGEVTAILSRAVILATGGLGQLFARTTNPPVATGDGMAIAFRAGAVLEDMEFVQFHPTSLYYPSAPQFLLSEAMRGEGAILRNIHGGQFMSSYHPMAELAPRDVVSRAIISEMVRTKSKNVFLDLTHLDGRFIKNRFPRIYSTCLQYDIDITEEPVPVSPAAHYMMGGVWTDLNGQTSIEGLFAAGEVACTGVHGANRLASNSLLEGLVYGARAGQAAASYGEAAGPQKMDIPEPEYKRPKRDFDPEKIRSSLRKLLWERVGIIRCARSLTEAKTRLSKWTVISEMDFRDRRLLELKNMLTVAMLITEAALRREGSVGAHYRSDFPARGKNWQRHINIRKEGSGFRMNSAS